MARNASGLKDLSESFRGNFVITGNVAFEEDTWNVIKIGNVAFKVGLRNSFVVEMKLGIKSMGIKSYEYVVQLIVPSLDQMVSEYRYFAIVLLCSFLTTARNIFELFQCFDFSDA